MPVNVADMLEREILPRVEKPSRYLGNEVNATRKDPATVQVRIALAFPDLYDLGLGNLGIHILYTCVNALPWASCERVYAPAIDMARELRAHGLPLFGLESKDGLDAFDALGFTLQTELTYTNILEILDLSGIPLRSVDREDRHPLILAGGPAVFNPEPLSPFVDAFVIGDGEDAIVEIVSVLRDLRGASRADKLAVLSGLDGVYVPALYPMETLPDGRVRPPVDGPRITKRIVRDLNGATFPVDYIVPFTQQVHDRVSLEVLRGCTQGCRFCQAGMVTRPVRERRLERVDELLRRTLETTGYEEVSLVSLSTCDHSRVRQLVENTVETLKGQHVSVSLPSLRLDSFSVELADMVAEERRTGLTVAPEAASPRLRAVINKWIPDEDLLGMADQAFQRGWQHVKLYFMIGLPTERDDDILAIADLAGRALEVGKRHDRFARINLGVSTFVPKPFTPFQWAAQIPYAETVRKQDVLQRSLRRHRDLKFGRHHPEETFLEGLISRGDRRVGDLIEAAWRRGARFDAWSEHLRFDAWQAAIADVGFDVDDAIRERALDERLPWDHIDVLVSKEWLVEDWKRALELKHAEDCRHKRCHKCGVIDHVRPLCASMLRDHVEGRKTEKVWTRTPSEPLPEPESVQRLWLRIARTGKARFLSHLEQQSAWLRTLRRAKIPLAYSHGFHPHPKIAFSTAAPLGQETVGDYLDLTLVENVDVRLVATALQGKLPEGFEVLDVREVPLSSPALMSLNEGGVWKVRLPYEHPEVVRQRVLELGGDAPVLVERSGKTRTGVRRGHRRKRVLREIDIRPMILDVRYEQDVGADGTIVPSLHVELISADGRPPKIGEIVARVADRAAFARIVRVDTLCRDGERWVGLFDAPALEVAPPAAPPHVAAAGAVAEG